MEIYFYGKYIGYFGINLKINWISVYDLFGFDEITVFWLDFYNEDFKLTGVMF